MAFNKFADFLNRFLYEEGSPQTADNLQLTPEEMAEFEASMSEGNEESVTDMAARIITESQVESDNDEYPDICNVQSVLDTAGPEASHDLIRKILMNFAHCDPDALEMDGIKRKQAILDAIEQTKKQAAVLKTEKAQDEQSLAQQERDAEAACTEAISKANQDSERAIEEEKARSAAIIEQIRKNTDAATDAAKQERAATLEDIAAQRSENEAALRKSASLVAETERQGKIVIDQIDEWLGHLKVSE